jgi:hypothetical protein
LEDDDLGSGQATREVEVVDAAGALGLLIEALSTELDGVDNSSKWKLRIALKILQDHHGALDWFRKGEPALALIKIKEALMWISQAEKRDSNLDLSEIKEGLALVAKSAAAVVIAKAEENASNRFAMGPIKKAKRHLSKGDQLLSTANYIKAVSHYHMAIVFLPRHPRIFRW